MFVDKSIDGQIEVPASFFPYFLNTNYTIAHVKNPSPGLGKQRIII